MGVMRRHKDSVMAMLEAFLHDPLLNWRLMEDETEEASGVRSAASKRYQSEGRPLLRRRTSAAAAAICGGGG